MVVVLAVELSDDAVDFVDFDFEAGEFFYFCFSVVSIAGLSAEGG